MPTNLGAQPSNAPLPVGYPIEAFASGGGGELTWPGGVDWLYANTARTLVCQVGVRRTYRFYLKTIGYAIHRTGGAWTSGIIGLRYIIGGAAAADLRGRDWQYAYVTSENHGPGGGWDSVCIEAAWWCEANQDITVQLLGAGGGGTYYSGARSLLGIMAYTFGEGVD